MFNLLFVWSFALSIMMTELTLLPLSCSSIKREVHSYLLSYFSIKRKIDLCQNLKIIVCLKLQNIRGKAKFESLYFTRHQISSQKDKSGKSLTMKLNLFILFCFYYYGLSFTHFSFFSRRIILDDNWGWS